MISGNPRYDAHRLLRMYTSTSGGNKDAPRRPKQYANSALYCYQVNLYFSNVLMQDECVNNRAYNRTFVPVSVLRRTGLFVFILRTSWSGLEAVVAVECFLAAQFYEF